MVHLDGKAEHWGDGGEGHSLPSLPCHRSQTLSGRFVKRPCSLSSGCDLCCSPQPHSLRLRTQKRGRSPVSFAAAKNAVSLCVPSEHGASSASHVYTGACGYGEAAHGVSNEAVVQGWRSPEMAICPLPPGHGSSNRASGGRFCLSTRVVRGGPEGSHSSCPTSSITVISPQPRRESLLLGR